MNENKVFFGVLTNFNCSVFVIKPRSNYRRICITDILAYMLNFLFQKFYHPLPPTRNFYRQVKKRKPRIRCEYKFNFTNHRQEWKSLPFPSVGNGEKVRRRKFSYKMVWEALSHRHWLLKIYMGENKNRLCLLTFFSSESTMFCMPLLSPTLLHTPKFTSMIFQLTNPFRSATLGTKDGTAKLKSWTTTSKYGTQVWYLLSSSITLEVRFQAHYSK